jgi:hypothetical protein
LIAGFVLPRKFLQLRIKILDADITSY